MTSKKMAKKIVIEKKQTEKKTTKKKPTKKKPTKKDPTKKDPTKKEPTERKPTERRPNPRVRFDQHEHFPEISEAATKCKKENCKKKTFIYCTKCENHLCFVEDRNCFTNFHFSNDYDYNMSVKYDINIRETRPDPTIRFDKQCHFLVLTSREVRCKNEECKKKTSVFCVKCKVHLCLVKNRNCFIKFHQLGC